MAEGAKFIVAGCATIALAGAGSFIGIFLGGVDFSGMSAAFGEAVFTYGNFIMAIINFLIIAFVVFMLVRQVNKIKDAAKKEEAAAPAPAPGPSEKDLLADILKALKK